MPEQHTILGGKVYVYKRPNSSLCSAQAISLARIVALVPKKRASLKPRKSRRNWYLQLRGKLRAGEIKSEKTFREVSEQYLREYDIIRQEQRNSNTVDGQHWRSSVHLVPLFGHQGISEITAGKSRSTEFTDTSKQLLNAASHRDTAPCVRKS